MSKLIAFLLASLIFCGILNIARSMGADISYIWGVVGGIVVGLIVG